jgi:hypothetical protein
MSFEAKRLRVQLPCGQTTELDEAVVPGLAAARFDFGTFACGFGSAELLAVALAKGCGANHTCRRTPPKTRNAFRKGPEGSDTVVVDAEDLPVLRAQLEAQLERIKWQLCEIETAQNALDNPGPTQ